MSMQQCDFYCDLDKVENLEKQYCQTIQMLTEYYYKLNDVVQAVKAGDSKGSYWQGDSFNNFMEEFKLWEDSYLRILSMLIVADTCLLSACSVSSQLIQKRDNLAMYMYGINVF